MDKNLGIAVMSHANYDKLIDNYFNENIEHYTKLDNDPLDTTIREINKQLNSLNRDKHISHRLLNKIKIKKAKIGTFNIIPKLHKPGVFGVRPLVNCIGHPTSNICIFIDVILNEIIRLIAHILKDSQNLIQLAETFYVSEMNAKLTVGDFSNLYTNILKEKAIEIIPEFLKDKLASLDIDIIGFRQLLIIIFENSIFKAKNDYYVQKIGVAMGCCCGPSIANIFLYILETKWLHIHKPLHYFRFIDDVFIISTNKIDALLYQSFFFNLKIDFIESEEVIFLDLRISINQTLSKLNFKLYIKPTNTQAYLKPTSNHPQHIFKNIPKSLLIRTRRICSEYSDYLFESNNLCFKLAERGYDIKKCFKVANGIGNQNRQELIKYKPKINDFCLNNKNQINVKFTYDSSITALKQYATNSFTKLQKTHLDSISNIQLKTINQLQPNFKMMLISGFKLNNFVLFNYSSCNKTKCITCKYAAIESCCIQSDSFTLPVLANSSCDSTNCIYVIKCEKCNKFYIGQTNNMKKRLSTHLSSIRKFSLVKENVMEVAEHFNLKDHDYTKDLKFWIIKKDLSQTYERLTLENIIIHLFMQREIPILNAIQPSIYKITNFNLGCN